MKRRRDLLHPESARKKIGERARLRAAKTSGSSTFRVSYGWLLVFVDSDGTRHYEDTPSDVSYAEAVEMRARSMAAYPRCEKVWLIQKLFDPRAVTREEAIRRGLLLLPTDLG